MTNEYAKNRDHMKLEAKCISKHIEKTYPMVFDKLLPQKMMSVATSLAEEILEGVSYCNNYMLQVQDSCLTGCGNFLENFSIFDVVSLLLMILSHRYRLHFTKLKRQVLSRPSSMTLVTFCQKLLNKVQFWYSQCEVICTYKSPLLGIS